MNRRLSLMRVAKRGGIIACLLLLAVWGASFVTRVRFVISSLDPYQNLAIESGAIRYWNLNLVDPHGMQSRSWWELGRAGSAALWTPRFWSDGWSRIIEIPLWLPVVVVALPTALLQYWGRRRRVPGYCRRCGYNLTGLTDARCPECGEPFEAKDDAR